MMKRCGVFFWIVAAVCFAPRLLAQTPTARAWADSTEFLVGDAITVHVEITHDGKLNFSPLVGDTLGVFHILSRDPVKKSSVTTSSATFIVSAYDSGTAILPPLQFAYKIPPDSAFQTVATDPLIFRIHLVEVDTSKEIKDIKPVLSVSLTVAEISLILGTAVALAWLGYSIYIYRKRKKERKPVEKYVAPPKPAHVLALEELAQLKEKRLWQQALIKPYYSEVTEILRRYFENRYAFMALEKTTDETLDDLRRFAGAHSVLDETAKILRRADLVKFAKYEPAIPEHEEMMTVAFDIIEKTKLRESTPSSDMIQPTCENAKVTESPREAANV